MNFDASVLEPSLKLVIDLTTLVVIFSSLYWVFMSILALRAKIRARVVLRDEANNDEELKLILEHAHAHSIQPGEFESARRKIETKIVGRLSNRDRDFIKEGLHQPSPVGAKRYAKEVLTGA